MSQSNIHGLGHAGHTHEASPAGTEFSHEALLYSGEDEFIAESVPFIQEGVEGGDSILVVVSDRKIGALRTHLGDAAVSVEFADMAEVGTNPARIIPVWREFVDTHLGAGRPVRGIGEPIWAARTPAELVECERHEALLNLAFVGTPAFRLLCPYDTSSLPARVIEEAERNHPLVQVHGAMKESALFPGLAELGAPFDEPLPDPTGLVEQLAFNGQNLHTVRAFVTAHAAAAGMPANTVQDTITAVNELASNSVRHAGGAGTLWTWVDGDEDAVIFEVRDSGRIADPLVDRLRPSDRSSDGRGLWIANQLSPLLQIRTFPSGNVFRLHTPRRATA